MVVAREPIGRPDYLRVSEIWERCHSHHFSLPSVHSVVDDKVILKDGDVVGYGVIKPFAEGIMVIDTDQPRPTQAKAIILAIDHALGSVKARGLETLYVATDDPHYADVLQKHWGFQVVRETVLRKEVT